MDYGNEIILACSSGMKELEAIIDYTEKIRATQDENMRQIYTDNRADELPHIQNLVVALTEMLIGEEPTTAAQMDDTEKGDANGGGGDTGGDDK